MLKCMNDNFQNHINVAIKIISGSCSCTLLETKKIIIYLKIISHYVCSIITVKIGLDCGNQSLLSCLTPGLKFLSDMASCTSLIQVVSGLPLFRLFIGLKFITISGFLSHSFSVHDHTSIVFSRSWWF